MAPAERSASSCPPFYHGGGDKFGVTWASGVWLRKIVRLTGSLIGSKKCHSLPVTLVLTLTRTIVVSEGVSVWRCGEEGFGQGVSQPWSRHGRGEIGLIRGHCSMRGVSRGHCSMRGVSRGHCSVSGRVVWAKEVEERGAMSSWVERSSVSWEYEATERTRMFCRGRLRGVGLGSQG